MADAKIRILVPDKLAQEGLDFLSSQTDVELVSKPGITEDDLAKIAGEFDGLIVRSGIKVTSKTLLSQGMPGRLKAIARAGVGVDNIDLDAATEKGVLVMNSAEASTLSTAEHAFTLLMALCRQVGPAYMTMYNGGWDRNKFMGRQLHGKTLGVVGFGRIGRTVAERALAFGMNVVAYDPLVNVATMLDGRVKMFRVFTEMLPHVDMLTFHVPLTDETRGMLNEETFKLCRKGVLVINAARGGVVDEVGLVKALENGQCGGAGLDVFTTEPPAADSSLRKHPKVLCTPHLGASTHEAQQAVSIAAAEQLLEYLRGQGIRGAVNAGGIKVDLTPVQQAFVDLVQRMAALISPMITRGMAGITLELTGKELAPAAATIQRVALVSLLQSRFDVPVNIVSVVNTAEQRGIALQVITNDDPSGPRASGPQVALEIKGPPGSVDTQTLQGDETRRIVGRVYQDMRPRIVEINRYAMDMVPEGPMVLIQNEDRPGVIGLVGTQFGQAKVNIADMAISRRVLPGGKPGSATALMVLKLDEVPPMQLLEQLQQQPGILKIASVKLAGVKAG